MEKFCDRNLVEKVLRKKCYYVKVYGLDLIFNIIKACKFEKANFDDHLEYEITNNFTDSYVYNES